MNTIPVQTTLFGSPLLPKCCEVCVNLGSDLSHGVVLGCLKKMHMREGCRSVTIVKQQTTETLREQRDKKQTSKIPPKSAKKGRKNLTRKDYK